MFWFKQHLDRDEMEQGKLRFGRYCHMKMVRQNKINFLQPEWAQNFPLYAGFSTRNGGVSRPPFHSLNLGFNTEDTLYNVEGNRSTLCRAFDVSPASLLTVRQVHGNNILVISEPNPDLGHFLAVECDAIITNQPQIMVGILTADCYSVLFWHPVAQVIAAAHVGWRGAVKGILGKVLDALRELFQAQAGDLYCAIGPGISAAHYEVDRAVRDEFVKAGVRWNEIAAEKKIGQFWQLDIARCCRLQLERGGVDPAKIADATPWCTFKNRELFFSYRRDKGQTGRQMGFIMMRS